MQKKQKTKKRTKNKKKQKTKLGLYKYIGIIKSAQEGFVV